MIKKKGAITLLCYIQIYVVCYKGTTLYFGNFEHTLITPTKRSNTQHLVEYEKQLLNEENKISGSVMQ